MNQPRFRTDLVTSPASEEGKRFVDVTDPDSGQTFRFYEVEYAVATAMDGKRDVNALVDWARSELGLQPTRAEVETVISTLDALGYLGSGASAGDGAAGTAGAAGTDKAPKDPLDITDLSLGAPGKSPIRADQKRRREASNVDLGGAGKSPLHGTKPPPDRALGAPELELGAAGGADEDAPLTGAPTVPPLELGAEPKPVELPTKTLMGMSPLNLDVPGERKQSRTTAPNVPAGQDLSVDLGQHLNIGSDDVKEAVRASRVMSVPEVPSFAPEPMPGPGPGSTPIELPGRPPAPVVAVPTHKPRAPLTSAPAGRPSAVTIILGILLLAAIAAAAYYFLAAAGSDEKTSSAKTETPVAKTTTAKPAAPGGPVAMVTKGETVVGEVKSDRTGKVAWLVAAEAVVEKGDVIAKFDGFAKEENALEETEKRRDIYQTRLDKATAAGNKKSMRALDLDVKRKQRQVDERQKKVDAFLVKAPNNGVVALKIENGANLKEESAIATITSQSWPTATFTVAEDGKYTVGDKLEVVGKTDPSQTAVCDIVAFEGTQLQIKCPPESTFKQNAALTLK